MKISTRSEGRQLPRKGGKLNVKKPFILFLLETYTTVSSNLKGFTHLQLESPFVAGNAGNCSYCSPEQRSVNQSRQCVINVWTDFIERAWKASVNRSAV